MGRTASGLTNGEDDVQHAHARLCVCFVSKVAQSCMGEEKWRLRFSGPWKHSRCMMTKEHLTLLITLKNSEELGASPRFQGLEPGPHASAAGITGPGAVLRGSFSPAARGTGGGPLASKTQTCSDMPNGHWWSFQPGSTFDGSEPILDGEGLPSD